MTQKALHVPSRPLWLCEMDGIDWPCANARRALLAEYRDDRTALGVYLAGRLYEAAWDFHGTPAADPETLFARFLAWSLLGLPKVSAS